MIRANTDAEWLPLYEALASEVRLQIIRLVAETPMNVKDLAASLGLSSAIVTMHVRKLQDVGIIQSKMIRKDGGTHKMNSLAVDWIGISMPQETGTARKLHEVSVPVGHYTHFDVYPTCGLATSNQVIGQYDDPRYFLDPERMHAHILWLGRGFVEYKIPNYILSGQQINAIELSLEMGSEAPSVNPNWPSDITFMLNGIRLGEWTSPGDSGNGRGMFTPEWWSDSVNQYGMLKVLRITHEGTFIDGQHLSEITLADIPVERNQWTLRLSVEEDAQHVGGLTLYGQGFGNYDQDILFRLYYHD
ncbi:transcriptional regulator [Paenibacillus sp. PCH8]|uniref:ArsR/SmtB family transcription factor n=1 Tax=Paenibacillus sp. PCH8 TaxID=2066524 RepID=UPI000CFA4DB0|nr:ArsR family transcriptional regulator [Paenibacillus sp. PCH8]PQP83010.1 transcriptional regulator [Paenibacillus sp. PCH8]